MLRHSLRRSARVERTGIEFRAARCGHEMRRKWGGDFRTDRRRLLLGIEERFSFKQAAKSRLVFVNRIELNEKKEGIFQSSGGKTSFIMQTD